MFSFEDQGIHVPNDAAWQQLTTRIRIESTNTLDSKRSLRQAHALLQPTSPIPFSTLDSRASTQAASKQVSGRRERRDLCAFFGSDYFNGNGGKYLDDALQY